MIEFITHNPWLPQFLLGILLGYYVMMPQFRRWINRVVMRIFWFFFPFKTRIITKSNGYRLKVEKVASTKKQQVVKPQITLNTKPKDLGQGGILVDEKEINQWLDSNSDLRKVNEA